MSSRKLAKYRVTYPPSSSPYKYSWTPRVQGGPRREREREREKMTLPARVSPTLHSRQTKANIKVKSALAPRIFHMAVSERKKRARISAGKRRGRGRTGCVCVCGTRSIESRLRREKKPSKKLRCTWGREEVVDYAEARERGRERRRGLYAISNNTSSGRPPLGFLAANTLFPESINTRGRPSFVSRCARRRNNMSEIA